jgi:uncharacterized protein (TIGR02453 family)
MSMFQGFPKNLVTFYKELVCNNNRDWFDAHKTDYRRYVVTPAQQFVVTMGERLQELSPGIIADTRINGAGSIFRVYRDTRFTHDKSPYKTFLGIFFWEGSRKKTENSGFYFHLEPEKLMLAAGIHVFPKSVLKTYRDAVVHPEYGMTLLEAIEDVTALGNFQVGGKHYKRIPRGYDANHKNAEFLFYNGLYAFTEGDIPDELFKMNCLDYCFDKFREMVSIHRWLVSVMEGANAFSP